jgi:UTP-glucose-1-phosphate uridylyltransferase
VFVAGGDDFIYTADGSSDMALLLKTVTESSATGGMLTATIPREEVGRYGTLQTKADDQGHLYFEKIIEHAKPEEAPSNMINISKYLFDKKMMDLSKEVLARPPAANGEYQLTEILNLYVEAGNPLVVAPIRGEYLDGGTTEGWLYANNRVVGENS